MIFYMMINILLNKEINYKKIDNLNSKIKMNLLNKCFKMTNLISKFIINRILICFIYHILDLMINKVNKLINKI